MADQKITDLTFISTPADTDVLEIVDVDDTTMGPGGTNKKNARQCIKRRSGMGRHHRHAVRPERPRLGAGRQGR